MATDSCPGKCMQASQTRTEWVTCAITVLISLGGHSAEQSSGLCSHVCVMMITAKTVHKVDGGARLVSGLSCLLGKAERRLVLTGMRDAEDSPQSRWWPIGLSYLLGKAERRLVASCIARQLPRAYAVAIDSCLDRHFSA